MRRGRQDILRVLRTRHLCSSSFLRHPARNISVTPTLFPSVQIKKSLFSPTRRLQSKPATITSLAAVFTSSLHTFLHQTYLWFPGFQHKLIFAFKAFHHLPSPYLSFPTGYWSTDSCFWSSREAFCYHPAIRFSNKYFLAFLHSTFPIATAPLLHFFSVTTFPCHLY